MKRIVETDAHEGPVYVAAEHALYFTTQRPQVDVKRLDLETRDITVIRTEANVANGMAPYGDGRLLVCEQHPAAVTLLDPSTGEVEVLVDSYMTTTVPTIPTPSCGMQMYRYVPGFSNVRA